MTLRLSAAGARRIAARITVLAGVAVGVLFLLEWTSDDPRTAHLFDCLHWTVAYVAAAIVAHTNLTLGDNAATVLEAHRAASPDRFRGVRHSTIWDASGALRSDAPPGLLGDSQFRRGFACLGKLNLSFDAWLYYPQLPELVDLARAFPQVTIILDHIGAPLGVGPYAGKRDEVFQAWSRGIAALAGCPNVFVKLGGVGSLRSGYDWHERLAPYKVPASVEFRSELPKSMVGKVLRRVLTAESPHER